MIYFDAVFLDGETSAVKKVNCEMDTEILLIRENYTEILRRVELKECVIESALGKTRNIIILPDGSRCETYDKRPIKSLRKERGNLWDIVHAFESVWPLVLLGIFATGAALLALLIYGVPVIGDMVAPRIPVEILESLSEKTISSLDEHLLQKSELPEKKQNELTDIFIKNISNIDHELNYNLVFRKSTALGANAFALPSGKIIITDGLAELYSEESEIAGIFAHEIAHAKFRHGIKSVIQNTGVFIIISLVMGDFTAMHSSIAVLPVILAESGYSRKFEKESDIFAGEYLLKTIGTSEPYQSILIKLSEKANFPEPPKYLSTHPPTNERVELLKSLTETMH